MALWFGYEYDVKTLIDFLKTEKIFPPEGTKTLQDVMKMDDSMAGICAV